jgi:ribosome maturation factor RimP
LAIKPLLLIFAIGKKKQMKGTEPFPSSFTMTSETEVQSIEKLLQPLLVDDIFLVSIKIKPTNNYKVYIDADSGLGIEKCTRINRALYRQVEETGLHPDGNFSLEVSSPGVDEPLQLLRQYIKNINRNVEVVLNDGQKKEGKLKEANETTITIEQTQGKGKKAVTANAVINFTDIKQTTVQIKF